MASGDREGRDAVDPDLVPAQFRRRVLRQHHQRALGARVRVRRGAGDRLGQARRPDDAPTAAHEQHDPRGVLGAEEGAHEVDGQHSLKILLGATA